MELGAVFSVSCSPSAVVPISKLSVHQSLRVRNSIRSGVICSSSASSSSSKRLPREPETKDQVLERRLRESKTVQSRVITITDTQQFHRELEAAGDKLVVLEIQSEELCELSHDEIPESYWAQPPEKIQEPCQELKHSLLRYDPQLATLSWLRPATTKHVCVEKSGYGYKQLLTQSGGTDARATVGMCISYRLRGMRTRRVRL